MAQKVFIFYFLKTIFQSKLWNGEGWKRFEPLDVCYCTDKGLLLIPLPITSMSDGKSFLLELKYECWKLFFHCQDSLLFDRSVTLVNWHKMEGSMMKLSLECKELSDFLLQQINPLLPPQLCFRWFTIGLLFSRK